MEAQLRLWVLQARLVGPVANFTLAAAPVSLLNQSCQLTPLLSDPRNYTLAINLGPVGIQGSPFLLTVEAAAVDPATSYIVASNSSQEAACLTGAPCTLAVQVNT